MKKLAEIFYMKEKKHFFWLLQEMEEMNAILKRMNKAKTDEISNKELIRKKNQINQKKMEKKKMKKQLLLVVMVVLFCVLLQNKIHYILSLGPTSEV